MKTTHNSLALLFAVLGLSGMVAKAQTTIVTDALNGTISSYDSTGTAINTIADPSGGGSYGITDNGAGTFFVANDNSLTVGEYSVNAAGTISTINSSFISGLGPVTGVAYSNGLLYTSDINGTVDVFDAVTGATVAGAFVQLASGTGLGVAVSGTDLFVSDYAAGTVGEYNAITGTAINASFATGLSSPHLLSISGDTLLVSGGGTVKQYSILTGTLESTTAVAGVNDAVLDGSNLYAAVFGGSSDGFVTKNGSVFTATGTNPTGLDVIPAAVPEPSDVSLALVGVFSLFGMMYWKRRMTV